MALPVPVLDHVVVNVRQGMDEAAACWRRLGFALTPRGHHTLGSINHLAMFASDYLELVGLPAEGGARTDLMDWPVGLNGLVFGTEDADALHAALNGAGVPCAPPVRFSRPVELDGGVAQDAVFRTVRLDNTASAAGRIYFCEHATRRLVWRDAWRRHPNGVVGVRRMVIAAHAPDGLAALFRRMFGAAAVAPVAGGYRLAIGLADCDVVDPDEARRRLGEAAPDGGGRAEWMAALDLRTASLDEAAACLRGVPDVSVTPARVIVPAAAATGVSLSFVS